MRNRRWILGFALLALVITELSYIVDPFYHHWKCWTVYAWPAITIVWIRASSVWWRAAATFAEATDA